MSFYDYKCPNNHVSEGTARMNDMENKPCPECGEPAKRQFNSPNVTFKLKPGESYLDTRSFNELTGKNNQNRRPE